MRTRIHNTGLNAMKSGVNKQAELFRHGIFGLFSFILSVLRIRDPGLGAFLTPGSYFLELRNHFFAFFGVKILKFFYEDPGSGMETVRIRDPGWKKVGSGIRVKHPGSATLHTVVKKKVRPICVKLLNDFLL